MLIDSTNSHTSLEIVERYIKNASTFSTVLYKQSSQPFINWLSYYFRRYGTMRIYRHDIIWHLTISGLMGCNISIIFDSSFSLETMDIQYRTIKVQDSTITPAHYSNIGGFNSARSVEHKQCIIDYISKMILGTY